MANDGGRCQRDGAHSASFSFDAYSPPNRRGPSQTNAETTSSPVIASPLASPISLSPSASLKEALNADGKPEVGVLFGPVGNLTSCDQQVCYVRRLPADCKGYGLVRKDLLQRFPDEFKRFQPLSAVPSMPFVTQEEQFEYVELTWSWEGLGTTNFGRFFVVAGQLETDLLYPALEDGSQTNVHNRESSSGTVPTYQLQEDPPVDPQDVEETSRLSTEDSTQDDGGSKPLSSTVLGLATDPVEEQPSSSGRQGKRKFAELLNFWNEKGTPKLTVPVATKRKPSLPRRSRVHPTIRVG